MVVVMPKYFFDIIVFVCAAFAVYAITHHDWWSAFVWVFLLIVASNQD